MTITIGEDRIESIEAGAESIQPDLRVEAAGGIAAGFGGPHGTDFSGDIERVLAELIQASAGPCLGPFVEAVTTHAVEHVLRHVGSSTCHDCPGPELTGAADPS